MKCFYQKSYCFICTPIQCSALPQDFWDFSDLVLFKIGVEYVSNIWKRKAYTSGVLDLSSESINTSGELNQALQVSAPCSDIWNHVQVMSSHTPVQPAIPLLLFSSLCPPTPMHPFLSIPHSSPSPSAPSPVLHPSPPSSTVWTGCRELWPFFHTPPTCADPSRWGSDWEPGPGRIPGILLYQRRVPRKCCFHHCHWAGLISAHAWTHRITHTDINTVISPSINPAYPCTHSHILTLNILEMICAVTGSKKPWVQWA